jgi:hypothetical protein
MLSKLREEFAIVCVVSNDAEPNTRPILKMPFPIGNHKKRPGHPFVINVTFHFHFWRQRGVSKIFAFHVPMSGKHIERLQRRIGLGQMG